MYHFLSYMYKELENTHLSIEDLWFKMNDTYLKEFVFLHESLELLILVVGYKTASKIMF